MKNTIGQQSGRRLHNRATFSAPPTWMQRVELTQTSCASHISELNEELVEYIVRFVDVPGLLRCVLTGNALLGSKARARLSAHLVDLKLCTRNRSFYEAYTTTEIRVGKTNFPKLCDLVEKGVFPLLNRAEFRNIQLSLDGKNLLFTCLHRTPGMCRGVKHLELLACALGVDDVRRFASSLGAGVLPFMTTLTFNRCPFREDSLRLLIEAIMGNKQVRPPVHNLEVINAHLNDQSMRAFEVAAGRERPSALVRVSLEINDIGPEGTGHMVASMQRGAFPNLHILRLTSNRVGDEGLQKLLFPIVDESVALQHLSLTNNRVGDDGLVDFCRTLYETRAVPPPSLKMIDFRKNTIGDLGQHAFAALVERGGLPFLRHYHF